MVGPSFTAVLNAAAAGDETAFGRADGPRPGDQRWVRPRSEAPPAGQAA